jgi:asparagine synthase (glutamine-hydrolysing)
MNEQKALSLLSPECSNNFHSVSIEEFKSQFSANLNGQSSLNSILLADTRLVLPNDMLYKVDLMSMAHGLEVRVPFLDHDVVEFAFGLHEKYKINDKRQKIILRDILKDMLPGKLHQRPKHGFEVPLLKWFRKDLKSLISDHLLEDHLIREQGIFNPKSIRSLKKRLYSTNPGDAHAHIWALIVFQSWYRKYFG